MANYERGGYKYTSATELPTSGYAATWAGSPVEKEVVLATTSFAAPAGVITQSAKQNDLVGLCAYGDVVKAIAGGAIAVGDLVRPTTDGKFITDTELQPFTVADCTDANGAGSSTTINTATPNGFLLVRVGDFVSGAGVTGGPRVANLVDSDTITLDVAQDLSAVTLTFTPTQDDYAWGIARSAAGANLDAFQLEFRPTRVALG